MANLKITLVKSSAGEKRKIRETVRTLGLRKVGQSTVRDDNPVIRGQIRTAMHLVDVEETD